MLAILCGRDAEAGEHEEARVAGHEVTSACRRTTGGTRGHGSVRRRSPEAVDAVLILIGAHDLAFRVDRIDFGPERAEHVDRRVVSVAQHEAMARAIGIGVETDDLTTVIDPLSDGKAAGRARRVERRVDVPAQQEPVEGVVRISVGPDNLPRVVDPVEPGPAWSRARHVDGGEHALVPNEAVTGFQVMLGEPHDLTVRVDELSYREGRAGRVERGEVFLAPEISVEPVVREINSRPFALVVDPVDAGVAVSAGRV